MPRRILLPLVACVLGVLASASPAWAHNSLVSSNPADGAVLDTAPTQLTFVFDKSVPLDTLTIEYIDATGVRNTLTGSTHGASGDTEVVTPLPSLPPGEVTTRWRLVGPDGHPITGRVTFTISEAAAPTTVADPAATTPAAPPTMPTVPPAGVTSVPTATGAVEGFEEPWSTPDPARWVFRMLSYVAIMIIGGVIATQAFVWDRTWGHPMLRRIMLSAIGAIGALALIQLLVISSDIEGRPPWDAFGGLSASFETDAGVAFGVRIALVGVLAFIVFVARVAEERSRWVAAGGCTLLMLGTWAYAGHSQSMRWAFIGIPLDVAHHAAAAAWIGGLAIVGLVAMREAAADELVGVVRRFGQRATTAVGVIVGTGMLQALRLVGSPTRLLVANHGRFLLVKLIVLGAMLKVADINRQRVNRRFQDTALPPPRVVVNLRRAMGTELAVGLAVIAITAAMVVSPPAVAQEAASASAPTTAEEVDLTSATSTAVENGVQILVADPTSTTAPPPADGTCAITSALSTGSTDPGVACLQQTLVSLSYLAGAVTGTFDEATDNAVRAFQRDQNLLVDGVVGPTTASALGIWSGG